MQHPADPNRERIAPNPKYAYPDPNNPTMGGKLKLPKSSGPLDDAKPLFTFTDTWSYRDAVAASQAAREKDVEVKVEGEKEKFEEKENDSAQASIDVEDGGVGISQHGINSPYYSSD